MMRSIIFEELLNLREQLSIISPSWVHVNRTQVQFSIRERIDNRYGIDDKAWLRRLIETDRIDDNTGIICNMFPCISVIA